MLRDPNPTRQHDPRRAAVPRVVVLDNAGIHTSKHVKAERKALSREGIYLYYLPPHSPELNEIEPVIKQIKHHDIPIRSPTSKAELRTSVEGGFATRSKHLREKVINHPGGLLKQVPRVEKEETHDRAVREKVAQGPQGAAHRPGLADPDFKRRLLDNSKAAIEQEFGIELPVELEEVTVVEDTPARRPSAGAVPDR
jgi:transposase